MARQVLDSLAEFEVLGDAAMAHVEASVAKLVAKRFAFLAPLPLAD